MFRFTVACLALSLAACATDDAVAETDADLTASTTLTEKSDGKTASFTEGQTVVVALSSNPSAGYDWAVTSTDKSFGQPTRKFIKSSNAVGAGGTTKLTWATKSPIGSLVGKHVVEVAYQRSWEKKPTKILHFTVEILAAGAQKPLRLTDADDKKAVAAKAGQDVILTLGSNPTTGYAWKIVSTDKTFGYGTETYEPASAAVGSGGQQVFTWQTQGALAMTGKHTVSLEYKRSWEKTALKTFTFTVSVP